VEDTVLVGILVVLEETVVQEVALAQTLETIQGQEFLDKVMVVVQQMVMVNLEAVAVKEKQVILTDNHTVVTVQRG
jgi:hypothetical protein